MNTVLKLLKISYKIMLVAIILLLITIICIVTFFDPNHFKPQINEIGHQVFKKPFVINGPIQWSWFPQIALFVPNATVYTDDTQSTPYLAAEAIHITLKIHHLFTGILHISDVSAKTLNATHFSTYPQIDSIKFKNIALTGDFALDTHPDFSSIPELTLTSKEIIINKTGTFKKLQSTLFKKHDVYYLSNITFQGLAGNHKADISLDLSKKAPKYSIDYHAEKVDIALLLSTFKYPNTITGIAKIDSSITATGTPRILFSQSGQHALTIHQGQFKGFNLKEIFAYSDATLQKLSQRDIFKPMEIAKLFVDHMIAEKYIASPNAYTAFNTCTVIIPLKENISTNASVDVSHDFYRIKGSAKLNLTKNTLRGKLTAHSKDSSTPLEIEIHGALDNPKFTPDLDSYINPLLKNLQKEQTQDTISPNATPVEQILQDTIFNQLFN